jgi:hypothetical protein
MSFSATSSEFSAIGANSRKTTISYGTRDGCPQNDKLMRREEKQAQPELLQKEPKKRG